MWLNLWEDRLLQLWEPLFWFLILGCLLCWQLRVALYKHKFTVVVAGVLHAT